MQITEKEVQSGLNFRFGLKHLSANMLSSNPIICGKCVKLKVWSWFATLKRLVSTAPEY
jgi:hypothetical protein